MDRLLLDVMCGKLATYLRMCGYDAAYALELDVAADGDVADEDMLTVARRRDRRIVTRDRDLAARAPDAILLEARDIEDQLAALSAAGFDLSIDDEPTYCGACNGPLTAVTASEPTPNYAPAPVEVDVWRGEACGQHFWKGSHWEDVAATLAAVDG